MPEDTGMFGQLMNSISSHIDDITKPEFDKTKEQLKSLKEQIEKNPQVNIDQAMQLVRSKFEIDCDELDMEDQPSKNSLWFGVFEHRIKTAVLRNTPEFQDLDTFVTSLENYAGLRKIIDSKDPVKRAKSWGNAMIGALSGIPFLGPIVKEFQKKGGIAGTLTKWADDMKEKNKGEEGLTSLGYYVRMLGDWLKTDEDKFEEFKEKVKLPKEFKAEGDFNEEGPSIVNIKHRKSKEIIGSITYDPDEGIYALKLGDEVIEEGEDLNKINAELTKDVLNELVPKTAVAASVAAESTKETPKEPKKAKDEELVTTSTAEPFLAKDVRSSPFAKNEKSNWTLCGGTSTNNIHKLIPGMVEVNTAKGGLKHIEGLVKRIKSGKWVKDGKILNFDIVNPRGDADDVESFYQAARIAQIRGSAEEIISQLNASGKNVCDIFTHSGTEKGHRAAGFLGKDENGQIDWYVLDPYKIRGEDKERPIKLIDYIRKLNIKIRFVVPKGDGKNRQPKKSVANV